MTPLNTNLARDVIEGGASNSPNTQKELFSE